MRAAEARRAEAEAAVAMRQARKREADEEVRARREVAKVAKALAEEAGRRYFGLATCQ